MWLFRQRQKPSPSLEETKSLTEHKHRRREVEGCAHCGIEVLPGNDIMVCSVRFDRWTLCMSCYVKETETTTPLKTSAPTTTTIPLTAPMYKETVLWEVDPSSAIQHCSTASTTLEATLQVYQDRPCLGFVGTNSDGKMKDYQWLTYGEVLRHSSQLGLGLRNLSTTKSSRINVSSDDSNCSSTVPCSSIVDHLTHLDASPPCSFQPSANPDTSQSYSSETTSSQSTPPPDHSPILIYAEASVEWYMMQYACILQQIMVVPVLDGTPKHQLIKIIDRCRPAIIITTKHLHDIVAEVINSSLTGNNIQIVLISSPTQLPYLVMSQENSNETVSFSSNSNVLYASDIATFGRKGGQSMEHDTATFPFESAEYEILDAKDISALIGGKSNKENTASKTERDGEAKSSKQEDDDGEIPRMLIPTSGTSGDPKLIMVTDAMIMKQFKAPSFGVRTVMYSFQPIRQSFDTLIKGGRIGLWSGDLGALHQDMLVLRPTHFGSTPVFWLAQLQKFNTELQREILKINTPNSASQPDVELEATPNRSSSSNSSTPNLEYNEIREELVQKWKDKRLLGNRCKAILVGGAPSSLDLKKWIWEVFGCHLIDGYGTSETGAIATNEVTETSNIRLIDAPEMDYMTSDLPYPRGEIVAFTKRITPGYYNDPVANQHAFIELENKKKYFRTGDIGMLVDGKLKVIDRKNAIFKLANGKFVAPAPLETLYGQSPLIKQALVYGTPGSRNINMVVVLTEAGIDACMSLGSDTITTHSSKPIQDECARLAMDANKVEYEIPQHIILSTEEWTVNNGCLTSSLKPCRPVLLKKYVCSSTSIDHVEQQMKIISSPEPPRSTTYLYSSSLSSGLEQVLREAVPSLGNPNATLPNAGCRLYSLGIDSLALSLLRSSLINRFGVDIPLTKLAGSTLSDLNNAVLGGGVGLLTDVDDEGPEALQAEADLYRSKWKEFKIDTNQATILVDEVEDNKDGLPKNTVLLTGATGFVGAFLLDELLRKDESIHVLCLVRAENKIAARERLQIVLDGYLLHCDTERWSIVVGDLAKERLDLSNDEWSMLVTSCHSVYHIGAIVNASLPLSAIRATNIVGTKTIIELCIAARAFLHHISSISVLATGTVEAEVLNVPPPGRWSTAYAKSKWVAEQIVIEAANHRLLEARIYRLGTMSSHSLTGACNANDTFTRIVQGIIDLKVYNDRESDGESVLPNGFYLAPIDWAVDTLRKISMLKSSSTSQKSSSRIFQKIYNIKRDQNQCDGNMEVVHILNNNLLPLSVVIGVMVKSGLPLVRVTSKKLIEKIKAMEKDNTMYTFRDIFMRDSFNGGVDKVSSSMIGCEKLLQVTTKCPVISEAVLRNMLDYLKCARD